MINRLNIPNVVKFIYIILSIENLVPGTKTRSILNTAPSSFDTIFADIRTIAPETKVFLFLMAIIPFLPCRNAISYKVNIVLIDKNGTEIGTITTTVPSLEVNKTTEIYAEDLMVYENIYDFKIK